MNRLCAGLLAVLTLPLLGAGPAPDKLDPDLAQHEIVGRLYVQSFKAGVRIPPEFRGKWSLNPKSCRDEVDEGDNWLMIEPVTVHFYDETHVVTAVKVTSPGTIALTYGPLIGDYHYMIAPPVLTLSKDGKSLISADETGRSVYKRCR